MEDFRCSGIGGLDGMGNLVSTGVIGSEMSCLGKNRQEAAQLYSFLKFAAI